MEYKKNNITWHQGRVENTKRQKLFPQKAMTIWLTGFSASGKSTLAFALEEALINAGKPCFVLDGDNIRHHLNKDLGFSQEDRTENIRRVAEVAKLMNDAGLIVITAFISPFKADREMARHIVDHENFREIFVSTSLEVCKLRDPKGLYAKANTGLISEFTGVSAPYEIPDNPDLILDTGQLSLNACLSKLTDLTLVQTQ